MSIQNVPDVNNQRTFTNLIAKCRCIYALQSRTIGWQMTSTPKRNALLLYRRLQLNKAQLRDWDWWRGQTQIVLGAILGKLNLRRSHSVESTLIDRATCRFEFSKRHRTTRVERCLSYSGHHKSKT